jgi:hypothetical protein
MSTNNKPITIEEAAQGGTYFIPCWIRNPDGTETFDGEALRENCARLQAVFVALGTNTEAVATEGAAGSSDAPSVANSDLFAVYDRRETPLPKENCSLEIWNDGEWVPCEWHPRTVTTKAAAGYLGTARTTTRRIQIGFHAWEQNEWEFTHYRIPAANAGAVARQPGANYDTP